jgi:hypothetical protein
MLDKGRHQCGSFKGIIRIVDKSEAAEEKAAAKKKKSKVRAWKYVDNGMHECIMS